MGFAIQKVDVDSDPQLLLSGVATLTSAELHQFRLHQVCSMEVCAFGYSEVDLCRKVT